MSRIRKPPEVSGADPDASDDPARSPAPPRRRAEGRTWELELLISGAVTYGLLQLPGAVDRWFLRKQVAASGAAAEVLTFGFVYGKLILYTLIAAFVLHLVARAYWVGLIGLDTVFPRGVRWEKLEYGPATEAYHRRRQPSMRELIRRADRFCSVIFACAAVLVLTFAMSVVFGGVIGVAALGISALLLGGERVGTVYQVLFWSLLVPMMVVPLVDKGLAKRGRHTPRTMQLLERWTGFSYTLLGAGAISPLLNVLLGNFRRRRANTAFFSAFVVLFAFFVVRDHLVSEGRLTADGYEFLPVTAGALQVDPRHYDDRRAERPLARPLPSIQSEVVRGPFVRLFLPYVPSRHNEAVRALCPGVDPLQEGGLRMLPRRPVPPADARLDAVLDCLARLQPVTLNGVRLNDLRFHLTTEPATGARGLLAHLPVSDMAVGANLLVVDAVPEPDRAADEVPRQPHHIPFWVDPRSDASERPGPARP